MHEFHHPPEVYAILSHTWQDEEVSYQEYIAGPPVTKAGYLKIEKFCELAAADGWKYVWVDTCCIDKSSSAELSEAINSMFEWYKYASICFVYMVDVTSPADSEWDEFELRTFAIAEDRLWYQEFQKSKWFRRGWTLQELLAPQEINFFNNRWEYIGTRTSLKPIIEKVTRIFDLNSFHTASTAQIFSWASQRETTRIEDQAYCLLGLVGVNMPLLYGEGERAFMRLQKEILVKSDDDSIFAWEVEDNQEFPPAVDLTTRHQRSRNSFISAESTTMLAGSIRYFANAHNVRKSMFLADHSFRPTWSLSNHGLDVVFKAYREEGLDKLDFMTVILNCSRSNEFDEIERLAIQLVCLDHSSAPPRCLRQGKDLIGLDLGSAFRRYWDR